MEYKKPYKKRTYGFKDSRKDGDSDSRNQEHTEIRTFNGTLKPLMSEEEKKDAQVLELSYDFSWRCSFGGEERAYAGNC